MEHYFIIIFYVTVFIKKQLEKLTNTPTLR